MRTDQYIKLYNKSTNEKELKFHYSSIIIVQIRTDWIIIYALYPTVCGHVNVDKRCSTQFLN